MAPTSSSEDRSRSRSRSPPNRQLKVHGLPKDQDLAQHEAIVDTSSALDLRTPKEWLQLAVGVIILLITGLPVGCVVFTAMLLEAIDRRFDGGFVNSGKELTGPVFQKLVPAFTRLTQKFNERFVKNKEDAYMINCIWGYGIFVPLMFFACARHVYQNNGRVDPWLVYVYHVVRIGPFFQNFAYVYTLCHKEGHSRAGLFAQPYNSWGPMRNWFNWWVGMFYGVLPATFAYGHSINHHKYNNGPCDIITTSDKPRDSFINWIAYLPRYYIYAVNISTVIQFLKEGKYKTTLKVVIGSLWFFAWVTFCAYYIGPMFAIAYVVFPFFEASLLLAAVNWSWHAFIDPANVENEFVQSITILDGRVNVLNEDAHVVHHQYPGGHWTDHPKYMEKHWGQYAENRGSVFRRTHAFEIFGMSVARDYDGLASKFVDLHGEREGNPLSHEQRKQLIKDRLRACWWGPRVDASAVVKQA